MSICREWLLVKNSPEIIKAKLLHCRSWQCECCRKERKAALIAKAIAGAPTRFLTLTSNPKHGNSPEERAAALAQAWRLIVKRLRRLNPSEDLEFLAVFEATKAGEPHLHILLRSPFIPQSLISAWMKELTNSPIVDIRRVRSHHEVASYLAKYIGKAPQRFGTTKRYWTSGKWEPPFQPDDSPERSAFSPWTLDTRPLLDVFRDWIAAGYAPRADGDDHFIAILVHYEPHDWRPPRDT